jgi:serine protease Do
MTLLRYLLTCCCLMTLTQPTWGADPLVLSAQQQRVEVIDKVSPSVVAIFAPGGGGGGSGVLISADGFALTNFHVTDGVGDFMKCGLNDGVLYDAVIVGLDPSGDVALIKLFGRDDFPHAKLGDSDLVQPGDWTFVIGNPFLLATDFQPTVTYGIVSGVHRYQYPAAGNILEYTDCIQVDTSINPGNSGGPLFSADGDLIGINGRGSFEKRGRVNSGAGYAISINQIKHFLDHLKSGRIVDHATLGATVSTDDEGNVTVADILEDSEAYYRGLREDDEIVSFGGRSIGSTNQFKNVLGIYPKGWKLPVVYRRKGEQTEIWVRLRGLHLLSELTGEKKAGPKPQPNPEEKKPKDDKAPKDEKEPPDGQPQTPPPGHAAPPPAPEHLKKYHLKKTGFANYYFNQLEQDRVLQGLATWGKYDAAGGRWKLIGQLSDQTKFEATLADSGAGMVLGKDAFLQEFGDLAELRDEPPGTGGLLTAWHHLRLLLSQGPKAFTDFYYLGSEPLDGQGETVDVLVGVLAGAESHWYFSRQSGSLLGYDFIRAENQDRCELRFQGLQDYSGKKFPKVIQVRHGDKSPALYQVDAVDFSAPGNK